MISIPFTCKFFRQIFLKQFFTFFLLQTMVTPLTQKYFDFKELENSVMYCLGGVVVIAGFLLVHWLSRHFTERVVFTIGLTFCNISCIWCLIFLANPLGQFQLVVLVCILDDASNQVQNLVLVNHLN